MTAVIESQVLELGYCGELQREKRRMLAVEQPIAIEVDGVAYAVMMASPADLEDYALGFALSEGLVETAADLRAVVVTEVPGGTILRLSLAPERAEPMLARVRMRVSEGSCGLCGLESIAEVLRPLPSITNRIAVSPTGIERALAELPGHQPDSARTGATHAAAFCTPNGRLLAVREDVGRHNALDKLIGALVRSEIDPADGFIVVSARCSYELVEKAVRAGCPMLVAISAPTSLAVDRAKAAGLTLVALARHDTMLVLCDPFETLKEPTDGL